jgi:SAM-dependent methyltransferase
MVYLEVQFLEQMSDQSNVLAQTADFEFAALNEAKNYRAALLSDFKPHLHGNVLEVGAGVGQITAGLRQIPEIRKLIAIEPNATFYERLRTQFPQQEFLHGTVNDLRSETDWNAILSINVLEHIETDTQELATYHRLLRPSGGALCLFVPARPEIFAPIDEDFGHFRRYTRPELRRKLEGAGFKPVQLRYYNFVGYFAWWVNFCLLSKRSFDVSSVRLFDRTIFPLVHGLESRICPPPIGQSLMAVATAQ